MRFNYEVFIKKTFLIGYFIAFIVTIFTVRSRDWSSIIFYSVFMIVPIISVLILDIKKHGDTIREILLGYSLFSFLSGGVSFLRLIWTLTYNHYNLFGVYRSVFFGGIFTVLERIIWWYQTQLKE